MERKLNYFVIQNIKPNWMLSVADGLLALTSQWHLLYLWAISDKLSQQLGSPQLQQPDVLASSGQKAHGSWSKHPKRKYFSLPRTHNLSYVKVSPSVKFLHEHYFWEVNWGHSRNVLGGLPRRVLCFQKWFHSRMKSTWSGEMNCQVCQRGLSMSQGVRITVGAPGRNVVHRAGGWLSEQRHLSPSLTI